MVGIICPRVEAGLTDLPGRQAWNNQNSYCKLYNSAKNWVFIKNPVIIFGMDFINFFTFCQKTPKEGIISYSFVSAVWLTVLTAALIWRMTLGRECYLVGYEVGNNYGAKSFKNSHLNFDAPAISQHFHETNQQICFLCLWRWVKIEIPIEN